MNNEFEILFNDWKNKPKHSGKIFITDGIVNETEWQKLSKDKRILYIFREAYGGDDDWNLADELDKKGPWGQIWSRIVEWTFGIFNTNIEKISCYSSNIDKSIPNQWLKKISILNIKKSDGKNTSDSTEIMCYAKDDAKEILKEIELIDPSIIICGGTFGAINSIFNNRINNNVYCDNRFYWSSVLNNKEILYIDFYHPSIRGWPNLLFYYAITNIYQQALIYKN